MKILLYGATGWIGGKLLKLLQKLAYDIVVSNTRITDYDKIGKELDQFNPSHVILAAGLTGRPSIDELENKKIETIETNLIGASVIFSECHRRNIHVTYLGTGCILEYDDDHPIGGRGFTEGERPNFDKSFYSYSKIMTENVAKQYPNVLTLRIRMPISSDLNHRNFITKISRYEKVVNIPNSMTVLHDLLPVIPDMMEKKLNGILNFTNPGAISHNEILDLYIKYINPNFTYKNFTVEEQSKILKAGRSNNCLDVTKLLSYYPQIPHIKNSIIKVFERMKYNLDNNTDEDITS